MCGARRPEGHNNPNLTPQQKQKLLAVAKWTHEYQLNPVTNAREHSSMLCTSCVAIKHSAAKNVYFNWWPGGIKCKPHAKLWFWHALSCRWSLRSWWTTLYWHILPVKLRPVQVRINKIKRNCTRNPPPTIKQILNDFPQKMKKKETNHLHRAHSIQQKARWKF